MRTKSIILGAAILAAGALSSMAQSNVYSLNVVGYVNVPLYAGGPLASNFTFFANPLDADGTGTNNTVTNVFGTNLPFGSVVYKFTGGGWNTSLTYGKKGGWNGATASLNPGEGCFVLLPAGSTPTNIVCAGTVLQGTLTNTNILNGFSVFSSIAPVSGQITATGNGGAQLTPTVGDVYYEWDNTNQTWVSFTFGKKGGFNGTVPLVAPGSAIFLNTTNPAPSWVQTFTVQ